MSENKERIIRKHTHHDAAVEAPLKDGNDNVLAITLEPKTKHNLYARWPPRTDGIVVGATFSTTSLL